MKDGFAGLALHCSLLALGGLWPIACRAPYVGDEYRGLRIFSRRRYSGEEA